MINYCVEDREMVAEDLFQNADLPPIEDVERWEDIGDDTLVCKVFWTNPNGGPSIKGYYKVEFKLNGITTSFSWDI